MKTDESKKKTHRNRNDLIGEHRTGDAGQAVFAVIFAVVWIADSFFLNFSTWLNDVVPNIVRAPAGILVLIVAGLFARSGLNTVFNEVREKPEIIRKGVFGIVRHPVYLGEILLYLGMLFISMSLASAGIWILIVLFLHYIARYEEKLLTGHFGEEYRKYMEAVPMWIPKISKLFTRP